jgi:hypothetical protein
VKVSLQRLLDPLACAAHEVPDGVRREDPEGVHQGQGVHVPLAGHPIDDLQVPAHIGPRGVDREEHHIEAL